MDSEVKALFERMAELTGEPITSERGEKEFYKNSFLKMDYNSFYGGYLIVKVMTTTGEGTPFGMTRKSKREMVAFLRGFIAGFCYNN